MNKYQNANVIIKRCHICGGKSAFQCAEGTTLREAICPQCGVNQRTSDIAGIIIQTFLNNEEYPLSIATSFLTSQYIFETQSTGVIHELFKSLPHYIFSEYFDDVKPGMNDMTGIRCEDLQNLTFSDNYFDLIITQDVLEHVKKPDIAFQEIYRTLKPGGYHIFTVPYHEGRKTITRINCKSNNEKNVYPLVFHYDPLRKEGAPVYTDFGEDIITTLESYGFITESICCSEWYKPEEIPSVLDENSFEAYNKYFRKNDLCRFFKYNSWVFRSKKPDRTVIK